MNEKKPEKKKAHVLHSFYSDSTKGSKIIRVYLNNIRANEDFALIQENQSGPEYKLDEVDLFE